MLPIWDTIKHAVLATATKIATMSLFWLEQMLPFCPKDIPDVDHKCCKKSRQKITFFPRYFYEKILDTIALKLLFVVVQHRQDWPNFFKPFFWPPLSKLIFYSILWLFCSHVKTPLKISAIIFHFPSIMKVVIDHFPKVFSGQLHKVKMNKSILLYDKSVSSLFVCPRISSEPWTTYDHETLHA